jgi:small-conductance mechanosensitive channel
LRQTGIEIPFPQRDIHIRSNATLPQSPAGQVDKGLIP